MPLISTTAGAAVTLAQLTLVGSHYRFSRTMESEADAGSVPLMRAAGYDPAAAPAIWEQLRGEQAATAAARNRRRRKNDDRGFFASHPPAAKRVTALNALVARGTRPASSRRDREAYRAALAPWWPQLLDDQIKLNDFGATDYLLLDLASEGWTPALLFARGELYRTRGRPGDLVQAAGFYRDALAAGAGAEAWRGLGLVQLRSGQLAAGRAALQRYLAAAPVAADRALIAALAGEMR